MLRIVRFSHNSQTSHGILESNNTVTPIDGNVLGNWSRRRDKFNLAEVRLLAPIQPPNIIGIGLNYRGHVIEAKQQTPKAPVIFFKTTTALADPEQPIILPKMAPNEIDYEGELVIVIGKEAHNVTEDDALKYVFGYTCGNDVSARDCQLRTDVQWARGKSFDTFAPIGPWIETDLDEDGCEIACRLNGKTMQSSNTSDLIFNSRQLVSYISKCMTLLPGTVIMSGTPGGVGYSRNPPVFLRAGDLVEVEINGIGILKNPVVKQGDT